MGIPAFYRWLVDRHPLAVAQVIEEVPPVVNGVRVPIDTSRPNPNGMEFDNLYLDMNGIIHPCFHPDDQPAPKTYEEVFKNVFKYIDRIFSLIRPRKLLYMAVDGVAPRAKMNQQRARRFRAAKDAADKAAEAGRLSSALKRELASLDELEQTKTLDSNVITPGTEFMASLSSALQYYIHLRMNTDPGWRGVKVILSDANVPGEGEHKIMSYIRLQRNLPGFDPNTRHCLYGLDADLIMLALATHEVHFSILREDIYKGRVKEQKPKSGKWSSLRGWKKHCRKLAQSKVDNLNVNDDISTLQFQFLNIWVLRDYLAREMRIPDRTVTADFERLIDDFVFMCLFVGNDFLPHVPSLEISEGAIDLLMAVYKKEFVQMGGYLTDSFEVNLERVEHFLQAVGSHENAIFRKRSQIQMGNRKHDRSSDSSILPDAKRLKNSESLWSSSKVDEKKTLISISKEVSDDVNAVVDKVKLGEKGWKGRFYNEKFEAKTKDDQEKIRSHAVFKYIEGICWVMHYYYRGVSSWQWFYPYHYAPFASDFYGLGQLEIRFTLGEPFKPLNQLMSVLPAASAHALPLFYRVLMTDSSSPISDFYPTDFELDMNGKRFAWQAVIKLPFIMESRLLVETAKVEHTLTDEEKRRNSLGMDILFVHISHPFTVKIFSLCEQKKDCQELPNAEVEHKIDPKLSDGMNGYIYISDKPVLPLEIYSPIEDMEMITKNETISVFYKYPAFHPHIPRLPEGVLIPVKSIRSCDVLSAPMLWHEKLAVFGRRFSERPILKSISGPCLAKLSRRLVSEYYLKKQRQTVGSIEPKGHVAADGSHPIFQETVCEKKPDHGGQSCISGSEPQKRKWPMREKGLVGSTKLKDNVTTYCSSHHPNSIEADQGERSCINESRPQETYGLVSESCPIERQPVMGPAESNCRFTTGSLSCQPNSKETVCEKEPDDIKQSCINGSKSRKKKKKKNQSSIANGLQSESCPMKQHQGMELMKLNGHISSCHSTSQPNLKETVDEQEPDNGEKSSINVNATFDSSTRHPNAEEAVCEKGPDHSGQICRIGLVPETCPMRSIQINGLVITDYSTCQPSSKNRDPEHGEQSCVNVSVTTDCSGYQPNSKEVVSEKGPDRGEQSIEGIKTLEKRRVKKRRRAIANDPVSESCPMKQQLGIVSTDFNSHVATDCIPCQPNCKDTGDGKKPDKGEQSRITVDCSRDHFYHQDPKERVCEKVPNCSEQSGVNGLVSETCSTKPQQTVRSGEPKETAGERELVDVAIGSSMHKSNSEETVPEKGPDHGEQSCLNGSKSRKRKWVKKKHPNSMASGPVTESCLIGHQVVMGSAELNGLLSETCQSNPKEKVGEKELDHNDQSRTSVDAARDCSMQLPNPEETVCEKGPDHGEQSCINGSETRKRKWVEKKPQNSIASGLVSESCSIGHQVVMWSAEANGILSETCPSNSRETVREKGPDHGEQSCINGSETRKRKWVKKKPQNSIATGLVSESCPVGHEVVMWSAEPNGILSETCPSKSRETVREKGPDHGEQSCINGSETRKRKWVKKKPQNSIATGLVSESCPVGHEVVMWSAEPNGILSETCPSKSRETVREKGPDHGEQSCINGSETRKRKWVKKKPQNSIATGLVSESCPVGHQVVMWSAEPNGILSETCPSNPREAVAEKELDHNDQSRTNVDVAMDCTMHLPNSEEKVHEKGPDHVKQSCLNGLAVVESRPIRHQVVMGSAERNSHVTTGGSTSQLNSKETAHEKELNHGEAGSIKLSRSQRKNQAKKRAKERRRLQSQENHGEAGSIKLNKSQKKIPSKKRAKKRRRLQSQEAEAARTL